MVELVIFRCFDDEEIEHKYGLLTDQDEPRIICLDSGCVIEMGEYEIVERVQWLSISQVLIDNAIKNQGGLKNDN